MYLTPFLALLVLILAVGPAVADECVLPARVAQAASVSDAPAPGWLDAGRDAVHARRHREGIAILEKGLAATLPGDEATRLAATSWLSLAAARSGQRERSAALWSDAMAMLESAPARGRYEALMTTAPVAARARGREAATAQVSKALGIARELRDPGMEAFAHAQLARLEADAGKAAEHAALAGEASNTTLALRLAMREVLADSPLSSTVRERNEAALATLYGEANRSQDAQAIADSLGVLALSRWRGGQSESALEAATRAIAIAGNVGDPPRLHDWLWLRARIHADAGRADEALADYGRAEERLQKVRPDVESELADFGLAFRERYGALYLEYADLLLARADASSDSQARRVLLVRARDTIETSKTAEVADYFRDPCIARNLVRADLERIDSTSVILYYVALRDRVVVLLSHREGIEQVRLSVEPAALARTADEFRRLAEKRSTRQYLRPSRALYAMLVKPLEARLAQLAPRTLVIVPDGILRTLPFSALHDGRDFLVTRYAIAVAPSLSLTAARSLSEARPFALINGLTQARQGFGALPAVEEEVAALREIVPSIVVMNEAFLKRRLIEEFERAPVNIVHIASHGQFSPAAQDTFILTFDERLDFESLRAAIAAGKSKPEPIEILTLSACQSAAGDERAALGLAGVAVRAGARSALASLWFVNDESTALVVTEFYRNAITRRMPRAQALREAQLTLMKDERFEHPAYWSAFLLIGSWL